MSQVLFVGLGGFIGSILRYKLGGLILHHTTGWRFPLSTLVVNVAGCAVAGILAGYIARQEMFNSDLRIFLFTGLLGGFTTFSAFGLETVTLFQQDQAMIAVLNVICSVLFGLGALWLGLKTFA